MAWFASYVYLSLPLSEHLRESNLEASSNRQLDSSEWQLADNNVSNLTHEKLSLLGNETINYFDDFHNFLPFCIHFRFYKEQKK